MIFDSPQPFYIVNDNSANYPLIQFQTLSDGNIVYKVENPFKGLNLDHFQLEFKFTLNFDVPTLIPYELEIVPLLGNTEL